MPSRKSPLSTPQVAHNAGGRGPAHHRFTVEQAEALAALPSATSVEVPAVHNKCASRKKAQVHEVFEKDPTNSRATRSASAGCGIQSVLLCDKGLDRILSIAWWVMEHLF